MSDFLVDLVRPERLTCVVDIGANPIDSQPPYQSLLQKRLCRVFGFEPQAAALATLNGRKSDLETYLPYAVGDRGEATLKMCEGPGMTSLLDPDPLALNHFQGFPQWGRVVQTVPVATHRLDDIAEIERFDLLKMDVQGAELAVLRNASERLKDVVAIETEVSFIPLYKNQPAFGDIDLELRRSGFLPHCFTSIKRRLIAPMVGQDLYQALNQLVEADIVYVRSFLAPERMSPEQLKHLAVIAHHCYRSFDLAVNCLFHLAKLGAVSPDAVPRYVASLKTVS